MLGCESIPGTARKKEGRGCCRFYALPLQANASSQCRRCQKGLLPQHTLCTPGKQPDTALMLLNAALLRSQTSAWLQRAPQVAPQGQRARVERGRMQGSVPAPVTPFSLSCDTCFCSLNMHDLLNVSYYSFY